TVNETENYYESSIKYLIFGNVLKNATYPLSVSAERVSQATAIAMYAKEIDAEFVAHGSTGAGNDQVRFDMIFNILIPDVKIITPIRDMQLSREEEIKYLQDHGVEFNAEKAKYSRSEEHTSELQSRENIVCRLLLEKKKTQKSYTDYN